MKITCLPQATFNLSFNISFFQFRLLLTKEPVINTLSFCADTLALNRQLPRILYGQFFAEWKSPLKKRSWKGLVWKGRFVEWRQMLSVLSVYTVRYQGCFLLYTCDIFPNFQFYTDIIRGCLEIGFPKFGTNLRTFTWVSTVPKLSHGKSSCKKCN